MRNRTGLVIGVAVGMVVLGRGLTRAQEVEEPEPCSDTVRLGDASKCWAREAERADSEMKQAYLQPDHESLCPL